MSEASTFLWKIIKLKYYFLTIYSDLLLFFFRKIIDFFCSICNVDTFNWITVVDIYDGYFSTQQIFVLVKTCFPVDVAKFFKSTFFYIAPPVAASINMVLPKIAQQLDTFCTSSHTFIIKESQIVAWYLVKVIISVWPWHWTTIRSLTPVSNQVF